MRALIRTCLAPGIGVLLVLALVLAGPIGQPADYHAFADQRSWLGVANAGDVLSNLGFLLVAAYGAVRLWRLAPGTLLRTEYAVFFAALALTAAGSSWYHLAPDNARLIWDRLPIALACAALLAASWRQAHAGTRAALPLLLAFGAASVWWWSASGDLRPYLLIQLAPLALIPALQWQCGAPSPQRKAFAVAIALYVLAKLCEVGDHAGLAWLGLISGHTLKHLLATAAAWVIARSVTNTN